MGDWHALPDGPDPRLGLPPRPLGWQQLVGGGVALALLAGVVSGFAVITHRVGRAARPAIGGISGYATVVGQNGKPLREGSPWGRVCQPVRFTVASQVPDSVYRQAAAVVGQARRDGVDVTIEDRDFRWRPASLSYPTGMTPADVVRVGIFSDSLSVHHLERLDDLLQVPDRVRLGWDTVLAPDGSYEYLTLAQGHLHLGAIGDHPVALRTALRQVVALTQGVISTSRSDSGLTTGTRRDSFSPADIAAMQRMSGCSAALSSAPPVGDSTRT